MPVLLEAFLASLSIFNIFLVVLGTAIGIIIGAAPGLGPIIGISLLIPITYGMDATTALLIMA